MENQTTFSILREGPYDPLSKDKLLGHPFDNWDALSTSICDISLAYPSAFVKNISKLSAGQREIVLHLVKNSLDALANQIPKDNSTEQLYQLILGRLAIIIQESV